MAQDITARAIAMGKADLDDSGKVPAEQLPGGVTDIVEVANKAALPSTGQTGKIYLITTGTGVYGDVKGSAYRWGGSAYALVTDPQFYTDLVKKVDKHTTTDDKTYAYGYDKNGEKAIDVTEIGKVKDVQEKQADGTFVSTVDANGIAKLDNTGKLDKVTTVTDKEQMYVKHADGTQGLADIPEGAAVDTEMSGTSVNAVQNKVIKQYIDEKKSYYIELTGTSGTLTAEQRETLLKGDATSNFIDKDHMLFKCVFYNASSKAVYSISGESKVHVITVVLPTGTWSLTTYNLQGKLTAGNDIVINNNVIDTKIDLDTLATQKALEDEIALRESGDKKLNLEVAKKQNRIVKGENITIETTESGDVIDTILDLHTLATSENLMEETLLRESGDNKLELEICRKQDKLIAGDNIVIESGEISIVNVITTNTDQDNISGNKTFTGTITINDPINPTDATNKQYVDEAVSSGTATYRGSFATKADLDAYTGDMEKGDYAIVASDETHDKKCTRYKCIDNGTTKSWVFEYIINDSPFTIAQLAALNSGITQEKVTKFDAKMNAADGIGTGTTTLENLKVNNKAQVLTDPVDDKDIVNLEYFNAHSLSNIDNKTIVKDGSGKIQTNIGGYYKEGYELTPLVDKNFSCYYTTVQIGTCSMVEGAIVRFRISDVVVGGGSGYLGCDITRTIGSDKTFGKYTWNLNSLTSYWQASIWIDSSGRIYFNANAVTIVDSAKANVTITYPAKVEHIVAQVVPIDEKSLTINSNNKIEAKVDTVLTAKSESPTEKDVYSAGYINTAITDSQKVKNVLVDGTSVLDSNKNAVINLSGKQNKLSAGDNITIDSSTNVISVANVVTTNTDQDNISGNKTFTGKVAVATPTDAADAVNKEYVDEAVSSGSATYRGSFATKADLDAYTGEMTKGDYAIVASDETHDKKCTRYKCTDNGTTKSWVFEYVINDSPFTAAQLAAINSGITTEKVTEFNAKMDAANGTGTGTTTLENVTISGKAQAQTDPVDDKDIVNLEYFNANALSGIDDKTIVKNEEGKIQTSIGGAFIPATTLKPLVNKKMSAGYGATTKLGECPLKKGDVVRYVVSNLETSTAVGGAGCDVTKTIGADQIFPTHSWNYTEYSAYWRFSIWIDASGGIYISSNGNADIATATINVTVNRSDNYEPVAVKAIPIDDKSLAINSNNKIEAKVDTVLTAYNNSPTDRDVYSAGYINTQIQGAGKVQDVTVNGKTIIDETDKVAKITTDEKTIITDDDNNLKTVIGGSINESANIYIDGGVTTLGSVDTNILAFDSQGTPEVTELHEGEYLKGKVTFAGMDIVFDEEITTQTVKKDTTHDDYTFIGANIANTGTADVFIGWGVYNGDMKPLIVLSTGDVATMLTMVTIDKVYSVERNYEKIDVNYIPFDTHMFRKERDVFTLDICDEVIATATKNATTGDIEGTLSSEDLDRLRNSDTNMFKVFYHDDDTNVDYTFSSSKYDTITDATGNIIRNYNYSSYIIKLNMTTGYYTLELVSSESTVFDNQTIVKNASGERVTAIGGYSKVVNSSLMNGAQYDVGQDIDTNIKYISSVSTAESTIIKEKDIISGIATIETVERDINFSASAFSVTGKTSGDVTQLIGGILVNDLDGTGNNLYFGYNKNTSNFYICISSESTFDLSTLTDLSTLILNRKTEDISYVDNKFIKVDNNTIKVNDDNALSADLPEHIKSVNINGNTIDFNSKTGSSSYTPDLSSRVKVGNIADCEMWEGTKAEYDAIAIKSDSVIYHVTDDEIEPTGAMTFKGSCLFADLPASEQNNGDYWLLTDTAGEHVGQAAIWSSDSAAWKFAGATITVDGSLSTTSTNAIQNKTVTKALSTKVGLTGDETIDGSKTFSSPIIISNQHTMWRSVDNDALRIVGGNGYRHGASVCLSGKDTPEYNGTFSIEADDGNTLIKLIGKPDGTLTWNEDGVATYKVGDVYETLGTTTVAALAARFGGSWEALPDRYEWNIVEEDTLPNQSTAVTSVNVKKYSVSQTGMITIAILDAYAVTGTACWTMPEKYQPKFQLAFFCSMWGNASSAIQIKTTGEIMSYNADTGKQFGGTITYQAKYENADRKFHRFKRIA